MHVHVPTKIIQKGVTGQSTFLLAPEDVYLHTSVYLPMSITHSLEPSDFTDIFSTVWFEGEILSWLWK